MVPSLILLLAGSARAQPGTVIIQGLDVPAEGADPGEILLGELNCVACHAVGATTQTRLMPKCAPLLGEVGARVQPLFLGRFLADPHREKPGTPMPDMLHDRPAAERESILDALTNFFLSLAGNPPAQPLALNRLLVEQGRVLYHRAGCVVCHAPQESAASVFPDASGGGPTDPEAVRFVLANLDRTSVPLGKLTEKYTAQSLDRFLQEPVAVRPSGRMPSLNLTTNESRAIAMYLLRDGAPPSTPAATTSTAVNAGRADSPPAKVSPSVVDQAKARRGRELFASLGCAACHELGHGKPKITSKLRARPLARLDPDATDGCLSTQPGPGLPRYSFSATHRTALRTTLARRTALTQPLAPKDQVRNAMLRLNCFACHSREGVGGPSPSRADYFTVIGNLDLGDEGRLPPHLGGVGRKLRPAWLREVLMNRGTVRPYMATRMPQFGPANVEPLVVAFGKADIPAGLVLVDDAPTGDAAAGRRLVGVGGCSCITCHDFDGFKSLSISVMDMTRMAQRLRRDWFRRYLRDPLALRPGTRMPTFWPEGKATLPDILGGDTDQQIEAIWAYLSQGKLAQPPPGLMTPAGTPTH